MSTISLAVLEGIKAELIAHLPENVSDIQMGRIKWYFGDTYIEAAHCPAIYIADRGWTKTDETCRGGGLSGATVGGMVWKRAAVEVVVWLNASGTDDQELRAKLEKWCDAVAAIMDSVVQLGDLPAFCECPGANSLETNRSGGMWLGAGVVKVGIDIFSQQGAVELEAMA